MARTEYKEPNQIPERVVPSAKEVPKYGIADNAGGKSHSPRDPKPFAFALAHGEEGASIWHGALLTSITTINVIREDGKNYIQSQDPIPKLEYLPAANLNPDLRLQTHLGWYGDVYAYWEADDGGNVSLFEIRGPSQPSGQDISELNEELERYETNGKYYVLIGTVDENSPVEQNISGDIPWFVTILRGEDGSSSSSSSSSSVSSGQSSGSVPSGSGGGSGGSSKSTCIVPASWLRSRFTALFTMEAPEVVFRDTLRDLPIRCRVSRFRLDHRFIEVCAPGTLRVVGITSDKPCRLGVRIEGDDVVVTRPWFSGDVNAQVEIEGIRKGFVGMRFPARDKEQFEANERMLNSAYPAKDL